MMKKNYQAPKSTKVEIPEMMLEIVQPSAGGGGTYIPSAD